MQASLAIAFAVSFAPCATLAQTLSLPSSTPDTLPPFAAVTPTESDSTGLVPQPVTHFRASLASRRQWW